MAMILTLATVDGLIDVLFRGKGQPKIQEAEFTPFDLSYLRKLPRETNGRPDATKPGAVAVFPPAVPFNSPQV